MNRLREEIVRKVGAAAVVMAAVAGLSVIARGQAAAPAQAPAQPAPPLPGSPISVANESDGGRIRILAGRSHVLTTDFDIRRLSITNPAVADARAVSPRELLIDGRLSGTISLIVWGDALRVHYELVVEPAVTTLEQRLHELFPAEDIHVSVSEGAVILSGKVTTNEVMLRIGEIAGTSLPDQRVINMLALPGGEGSQQVMLQVRVAEVNRKAVEELGLNLFVNRQNWAARATTEGFSAPAIDDTGVNIGDLLNLFYFNRSAGIGGVLKALEQSGNLQSLAEPNLIAYNGKQASVLVGGEIPVPIVSGNTGNVSVSWREFGVRLTFLPTIAGDVIRLHVRPEVSSLDFANGVTVSGFRIPALSTRYAETEVELRDGQSFAIAGLLNTIGQEDKAAIPILSQIPLIGNIFKSRTRRTEATELMVLITPRLVRPLNPDEVPPLPTTLPPGEQAGTASGLSSQSPQPSTPPAPAGPR